MEEPLSQCPSLFKHITSHPLFSILTTFFLLTFLYLPNLLPLIFSPVVITTSFLLTILLHFGESPTPETPQKDSDPIHTQPETQQEPQSVVEFHEQKDILFNSLVEWGRRGGPLEIIYEEYEGEEEQGNSPEFSQSPEHSHMMLGTTKRLEYFGCCSTESDADSDESLDDMCFRWGEEEEGMIEIALEEDNLIEIDLSACR